MRRYRRFRRDGCRLSNCDLDAQIKHIFDLHGLASDAVP
jgi:hypothetical protein